MYRMSWSVDRPPCLLLRVEKIRAIFYVKLLLLSSFESCERRRRRSRFSKCFYEYFVHLTQRWVYQDHTAFYAGSMYSSRTYVHTSVTCVYKFRTYSPQSTVMCACSRSSADRREHKSQTTRILNTRVCVRVRATTLRLYGTEQESGSTSTT